MEGRGFNVDSGGGRGGLQPQTLFAAAAIAVVFAVLYVFAVQRQRKAASPPPFLEKRRQRVTLIDKSNVTHNTRRFRFALDYPAQRLGLPVGKHVKFFAPNRKGVVEGQWNGKSDSEAGEEEISRKYTPVTGDEVLGHVEFVVKVYAAGGNAKTQHFPDGGKMSLFLDQLSVGDRLEVFGPVGMIEYLGRGAFAIGSKRVEAKKIAMIAGGTGLTPMLQLIKAVLSENDDTALSLLFANQTDDDILCREELDQLAQLHPKRFQLWFTIDRLSQPGKSWKFSLGHIDLQMIRDHLPPPADDTLFLLCGPPPMVQFAGRDNLAKLNCRADRVAAF